MAKYILAETNSLAEGVEPAASFVAVSLEEVLGTMLDAASMFAALDEGKYNEYNPEVVFRVYDFAAVGADFAESLVGGEGEWPVVVDVDRAVLEEASREEAWRAADSCWVKWHWDFDAWLRLWPNHGDEYEAHVGPVLAKELQAGGATARRVIEGLDAFPRWLRRPAVQSIV
jgi:hypothetical protein